MSNLDSLLLVQNTLKSTTNLFTGIPIKLFWKQHIFLDSTQLPSLVMTGRWSAFAHHSVSASILNICQKNKYSKVYLDPFLPSEVTKLLSENGVQTHYLQTLSQSSDLDLTHKLERLPVFYLNKTSETTTLSTLLTISQANTFPLHVFLEAGFLTFAVYTLLDSIKQGGFACIISPSPIQEYFLKTAGLILTPRPLVLSYTTENTPVSSLGYQLSDAKTPTLTVIQSLYQVISQNTKSSISDSLKNQWTNLYTGINKNSSPQNAYTDFSEYLSTSTLPIPDVLFELYAKISIPKQLNFESYLQTELKKLHQYLVEEVASAEPGSLMVPAYHTKDVLSGFIFYSTTRELYKDRLEKLGYTVELITSVNPNFASQYGLCVHFSPWIRYS